MDFSSPYDLSTLTLIRANSSEYILFLSMKYNESEAHKTKTCLWATWEIGKLQLLLTRFVVSKDLKS